MANKTVRVALIGVGNCASSLVQGTHFYRNAREDQPIPGLMHANLGGYHIRDIEFSAAFDINATKVGQDLAQAIFAEPNNTFIFSRPATMRVPVMRGPTMDGIGRYCSDMVQESSARPVDVAKVLRESGTDVVVCYLPVGSEKAARWYAEQVLEAGCGFVNCIPVFIASNETWRTRFEQKKLPIIGDDIKSQVGATITHRVLTRLFRQRGVRLDHTYQLNFGGNTDFLNMLERERLESKKISKRNAVTSQLDYPISDDNAHIGPSDFVPWLKDRKFCYIRMEGTTFGNVPLLAEVRMEVWDSPNSAGVVIDAVRCAKLALDRGIGGALWGPASFFMKSPPQQYSDDQAQKLTESFIRLPGNPRLTASTPRKRSPAHVHPGVIHDAPLQANGKLQPGAMERPAGRVAAKQAKTTNGNGKRRSTRTS